MGGNSNWWWRRSFKIFLGFIFQFVLLIGVGLKNECGLLVQLGDGISQWWQLLAELTLESLLHGDLILGDLLGFSWLLGLELMELALELGVLEVLGIFFSLSAFTLLTDLVGIRIRLAAPGELGFREGFEEGVAVLHVSCELGLDGSVGDQQLSSDGLRNEDAAAVLESPFELFADAWCIAIVEYVPVLDVPGVQRRIG